MISFRVNDHYLDACLKYLHDSLLQPVILIDRSHRLQEVAQFGCKVLSKYVEVPPE